MSTQCSTTELYAHAAGPLAGEAIPIKPQSARSDLARGSLFVEQPLNLKDKIFEMKGFRQDFRLRHRFACTQRNARETGDEHHFG